MSRNRTGNPDEARARAEAKIRKQEQRQHEADKVWAEKAAADNAADARRALLKAQRLAKEAAEQNPAEEAMPSTNTRQGGTRGH